MMLKPKRLMAGDTVGLVAPCYGVNLGDAEEPLAQMEQMGYRTKVSRHFYDRDWTFAASVEKRAEDFNEMAADDEVKMVIFGGGEVSNEILPYMDFDLIRKHPKIYCSYSDGTTPLNAITSLTGLVTYYGADPGVPGGKNLYSARSLAAAINTGTAPYTFEKCSEWTTLRGGECSGELIGGFLANFALMFGGSYLRIDKTKKYLLFLEDHEQFGSPSVTSKYLSHIEQSGFMNNVSGLILGHYADKFYPEILDILRRIADRYQIPTVKTDDFGHCATRGTIPIGVSAVLDADAQTLRFTENTVEA
ncbi:MAG: LD-carboxypeptidase [Eubacteriales bacterium]|nr:LD-carboxypeptidase [Eubacteriales bacterium]MDY5346170.1 LD-carboxypeptidase [Eubacteriales bacterium]